LFFDVFAIIEQPSKSANGDFGAKETELKIHLGIHPFRLP
jgi:hypothetical protein